MESTTRKRKASELTRESIKRTHVESTAFPGSRFDDSDRDGDAYSSADNSEDHDIDDNVSETRTRVDTPNTPLSPRAKFPSELKTLKCTYAGCTKTFNRPVRLEAHLRSHTNERPFVCDHEGCGKTYMQEKHLKQHIKGSHLHEKKYTCDWEGCQKSFLTGQRLRRHMLVHEGHERFRCTEYPPCNESFRKHQTMQRHIRTEHLNLPAFPCTHIDPETSVACAAGFDAAASLRKHVERSHGEPSFACDECANEVDEDGNPRPSNFTTKALLTEHIREEHANCMFCSQKCSSQQALRKHMETRHSGTTVEERKKVPCTYPGCGKRFVKTANLNAHIRSAHEGETFVCGEVDLRPTKGAGSWDGQNACGTPFASKANLVDHVRTQHMGLPTIINAGRVKASGANKKKMKEEPSAIDELTGRAYEELDGRDISCAIKSCPYKFKRHYDHEVHLKSNHAMTDADVQSLLAAGEEDEFMGEFELGHEEMIGQSLTQFPNGAFPPSNFGNANDSFEELYAASGDIEWQMQKQAEQGGAFWIGAEDNEEIRDETQWLHDEMEMQRLIDRNNDAVERFWNSTQYPVDPLLRDN